MLEKFLKKTFKIVKNKWLILFVVVIITMFLGYKMFFINFDNDILHMLPENDSVKLTYDKYTKIFGSDSIIIIALDSKSTIFNKRFLNNYRNIADKIERLNSTIPIARFKKLYNLDNTTINNIIGAISEEGCEKGSDIRKLLLNKEKLIDDYYFDEKIAEKIIEKTKTINPERLEFAYTLPIKKVTSLFNVDYIKGKNDRLIVEKLIPDKLFNKDNIKLIQERLNNWDIYDGLIVSYDKRFASILIELNSYSFENRKEIYEKIRKITKSSPYKTYIDGETIISDSISQYMSMDLLYLVPLVFIVLVVILFVLFKKMIGVFYPILGIALANIWALGIMSIFKVPFNLLTTVLPVVLATVISAYGIHLINHFLMENQKDKYENLKNIISTVGVSIVMAGLTTVAGFISLVTNSIIPIKNFGVFTAIGVFLGILITIYVLPSFLLFGKNRQNLTDENTNRQWIEKLLFFIKKLIFEHKKLVLIIVSVLILLSFYGISKIQVEMNTVDFFKKNSPVRKTDDLLNKEFAGTENLNVILYSTNKENIVSYQTLNIIDTLENNIYHKFPNVKKSISLTTFIKKMNQEFYEGKKEMYKIPKNNGKINDYMLLYSENLDNVVNEKRDMLNITLTFNRTSTKEIEKMYRYIISFLKKQKYLKNNHIAYDVSGVGMLYIRVNDMITYGQLKSLIFSLLVVFLILLLELRNILISLIGMLPLIFSLIVFFGFMGTFHIPLNAATALVASLVIGIGIDYSIHVINAVKNKLKENKNENIIVEEVLFTTGKAVLYNVISVICGFAVLLFSRFLPIVQFGYLIILNMLLTGLGALIIIPIVINNKKIEKILKNGGKK